MESPPPSSEAPTPHPHPYFPHDHLAKPILILNANAKSYEGYGHVSSLSTEQANPRINGQVEADRRGGGRGRGTEPEFALCHLLFHSNERTNHHHSLAT